MSTRTLAAAAVMGTVLVVAGGARVLRGTPLPPLPETVPSGMAQVALRQQDIAFFERRVTEDPYGGSDRARLAYLYLQRARETGDYEDFRRAEVVARASVEARGRRNAGGRLALASSLLAQHRFAEARAAAEALVQAEPESPSARALLAEIQMELGDYDGARDSFGWLGRFEDDLSVAPRLARWDEEIGRAHV